MSRRPAVPLRRGARLAVFRRLPPDLATVTGSYLAGESTELLSLLFQGLLDRASARRGAAEIEEQLRTLADFARKDIAALRRVLEKTGRSGWVSGSERDALFITARHSPGESAKPTSPSSAFKSSVLSPGRIVSGSSS